MDTQEHVVGILEEVLSLHGRTAEFNSETPLLGALPELDSMAVVTLITSLEERFDIFVEDDEVDGDTFRTVGTLVALVERKLEIV